MQEKVLDIPFNRDAFVDANKISWAIAYRKRLKPFILYVVLSVILLIAGIFSPKDEYHMFAYFSGALFLLTVINWSTFLEKRSVAYKKIDQLATDYDREQMDCTYIFF